MNFIAKILLSRYIKGLLDILPFDGKKTWLSGVLFLIVVSRDALCNTDGLGQVCAALALGQSFLTDNLGVPPVGHEVGVALLGTFVVGLFHKLLKLLDRRQKSA